MVTRRTSCAVCCWLSPQPMVEWCGGASRPCVGGHGKASCTQRHLWPNYGAGNMCSDGWLSRCYLSCAASACPQNNGRPCSTRCRTWSLRQTGVGGCPICSTWLASEVEGVDLCQYSKRGQRIGWFGTVPHCQHLSDSWWGHGRKWATPTGRPAQGQA